MKVISVLVLFVCMCVGNFIYLGVAETKLQEKHDDIYTLIEANNQTQHTIMQTQGIMMHYIYGHDDYVNGLYCPECSLLKDLDSRKDQLEHQIQEFAAQDSPTKWKTLDKLKTERDSITKHLYKSAQRSKEFGAVYEKTSLKPTGSKQVDK